MYLPNIGMAVVLLLPGAMGGEGGVKRQKNGGSKTGYETIPRYQCLIVILPNLVGLPYSASYVLMVAVNN